MHREVHRQIFHLIFGLGMVFFAYILPQLQFMMFCAGLLLLMAVFLTQKSPLRTILIKNFERKQNVRVFPGKGAFTYALGALITSLFFPAYVVQGLLVLALADSASTVIGKLYGRHKLKWSKKKSWEGSFAFLVVTAIIFAFFTPLFIIPAIIITFLETIDYSHIPFLDDNLLIPLVTSALLLIL